MANGPGERGTQGEDEDVTAQPPNDFAAYWEAVDRELAEVPAAADVRPLPAHETLFSTGFTVRLTSIGPYRIFGYYSVPKGDGPFPGLLNTPRYGSVNNPPSWEDRQRYAVLTLMHRGQRQADEPFAATYPGLLTHGIDDPATFIYRAIVADCLRGAEFLLGRPEVDADRVGIVGDDLAIITAARRPRFAALQISSLLFHRLMEARLQSNAYPIEEVNDHFRAHPEREAASAGTLAYVDPLFHAPSVRATTLAPTGDDGAIGGRPWLASLIDAFGRETELYPLTHEGGTDRDWMDAWMAGRLGSEPRPRVWSIAE